MLLIRLEYLLKKVSLLTKVWVWEQIPLRMGSVANWEIVPSCILWLAMEPNWIFPKWAKTGSSQAEGKSLWIPLFLLRRRNAESPEKTMVCLTRRSACSCRAETNTAMFVGPGMASSNCKSNLLLLSFPQTIYWTATYESAVPSGTRWNQRAESPNWIELELAA